MARVIFDLDGTLVDSAPTIAAAANALVAGLGREVLPIATVLGFVGHGMERLVTRVLEATGGMPEGGVAPHLARYRGIYEADPLSGTRVYAGVGEALGMLAAAGHGLGVCTQKPVAPSRTILTGFGLIPPVSAATGGISPKPRRMSRDGATGFWVQTPSPWPAAASASSAPATPA
jgi:phosphoglycolate phosphatase